MRSVTLRAWLAGGVLAAAACGQVVELGPPQAPGVDRGAPVEAFGNELGFPAVPPNLHANHPAPSAEGLIAAGEHRWAPRLSAAYFTQRPGLEEQYSQLGGAVPLRAAGGREPSLFFAEAAMLRTNDGLLGATAGMVFRAAAPSGREAQGFGVWLDGRDLGPATFRRAGLSWDSLTPADETRLNAYVPFGAAQTRLPDTPTTATFGSVALPATLETRLAAIHLLECERGWLLVGVPGTFSVWGFAGGYHGQAAHMPQLWGVQLRGECRFGDDCRLSAQFQADRFFGARGFFGVEWLFPGARPRGSTGDLGLADLLFQPMRRNAAVMAARPTRLIFP